MKNILVSWTPVNLHQGHTEVVSKCGVTWYLSFYQVWTNNNNNFFYKKSPQRQRKNEKSKCSSDPYSPYLQDFFSHLPYIIITDIWVASCNFTTQCERTSHSFKLEWNGGVKQCLASHSLKQIGSQVSWHMTMLNLCHIYVLKSHMQCSLPWILLVQNKFSMSLNKPTDCGNILNFIKIYI